MPRLVLAAAAAAAIVSGILGCASLEELGRRAADAARETVREDLPRILSETAGGALAAGMRGDGGGALFAVVSGLGALGAAFAGHFRGRKVGVEKGRAYERADLVYRAVAPMPSAPPGTA